jgi:hypothetical protein
MKQYNIKDLKEIHPAAEGQMGYIVVPAQLASNLTGKVISVKMGYFVEKEAEG